MSVKVSIIIPVYNVENFIVDCLQSVCNQTLREIEIICVDDCGTDKSIEIIRNFANQDSRIKIIHHKQNQGLGEARNTGMQYATGEYLGFVDSDDYVALDYFEKLYALASEKNADIVQSFVTLYHDDNEKWFEPYSLNDEILKFTSDKEKINKMDVYFNAGMCWNKIFRRELIEKHKIVFPKGLYWEDNPFVVRAAHFANKILPLADSFYFYRQREGSIIKLGNKKLHFDLLITHEDMIDFLNSVEIPEDDYLFIFNRFMMRIFWEYEKLEFNPKLASSQKEFVQKWRELFEKCLYKKEFIKKYPTTYDKIKFNKMKNVVTLCSKGLGIFSCLAIIVLKVIFFMPIALINIKDGKKEYLK